MVANWRVLVGRFEVLAMTSGLFLLAGVSEPQTGKEPGKGTGNRTLSLLSRDAFAICLPMFGVGHFLYPAALASWGPRWLPAHLFWAYFTGVAFWPAGLAILSGVLARLAARRFAVMLS